MRGKLTGKASAGAAETEEEEEEEEETSGVREGSRESADCVMEDFHVSARNRPSDVGTHVPPMILCAILHLHKP